VRCSPLVPFDVFTYTVVLPIANPSLLMPLLSQPSRSRSTTYAPLLLMSVLGLYMTDVLSWSRLHPSGDTAAKQVTVPKAWCSRSMPSNLVPTILPLSSAWPSNPVQLIPRVPQHLLAQLRHPRQLLVPNPTVRRLGSQADLVRGWRLALHCRRWWLCGYNGDWDLNFRWLVTIFIFVQS
jgi:hypothetical protein